VADSRALRPAGSGTTTLERRPVWPVTLLVVVGAYLLSALNVFNAAISAAPFFGEIPSRDEYIRGGMAALTGVLPCVGLALAGRLGGSKWGLALIGLPAAALLAVGMSMLAESGGPTEPEPRRAIRPADIFGPLTHLNWIVVAVLALVIGVAVWTRRRRRRG
jgi:hypothetical protein